MRSLPIYRVKVCPLISGCTTHKLSYLCNSGREMTPIQNYAPIRRYCSPSIPMEAETTMQLSYQPVDVPDNVPKPWGEKQPYCPPVTPMENNTTYNTSYFLPGTPCLPCPPCLPCSPCPPCSPCS
nr:DBF4-type zinc finger-containing protein 2 homolog [Megalopta genalis]